MPAAHATSQPPATRWLAEHALGFDYDMLPADARRIVRHCILDWYAVTLAACREPAVAALVDDALEEGAGGASPVIGHAAGVSQGAAALIQGTGVGRWLGDVHYRHGYHATATAGAVAAA
ncbi:MmgE/PrpD family protein, partial [Bordetella pertussis]|uniref:MmgE/PrpD family protein n=1 Tax=Bordetella pertussis TaxID=520 RepID=UPI000AEEBD81